MASPFWLCHLLLYLLRKKKTERRKNFRHPSSVDQMASLLSQGRLSGICGSLRRRMQSALPPHWGGDMGPGSRGQEAQVMFPWHGAQCWVIHREWVYLLCKQIRGFIQDCGIIFWNINMLVLPTTTNIPNITLTLPFLLQQTQPITPSGRSSV